MGGGGGGTDGERRLSDLDRFGGLGSQADSDVTLHWNRLTRGGGGGGGWWWWSH